MTEASPDPFSHPASRLVLDVFRLNGALIAMGDRLVAPLGLTSARWQVLGAAAAVPDGLPTADIARNMGLARQSVQRVVNDLESESVLAFAPNPRHRRAKLVRLTRKGWALLREADALWAPIAGAIVAEASPEGLAATCALLERVRDHMACLAPLPDAEGASS